MLKAAELIPYIGSAFRPVNSALKDRLTPVEQKVCAFDGKSEKSEAAVLKALAVVADVIALLEAVDSRVAAVWLDLLGIQGCCDEAEVPGKDAVKATVAGLIQKVEALYGTIRPVLRSADGVCGTMADLLKEPTKALSLVSKLLGPMAKVLEVLSPLKGIEKFMDHKIKIPLPDPLKTKTRPCPSGYKSVAAFCQKSSIEYKEVCTGR